MMKHQAMRILVLVTAFFMLGAMVFAGPNDTGSHEFNGPYKGKNLSYVNFPIGGIGAGMFCLEGTGAITQMSVEHEMEFFNTPYCYAAITVAGKDGKNTARVLEGPLAEWKFFGPRGAANGLRNTNFGLPRFREASFLPRFPFATIDLSEGDLPLKVRITGWSPFTPGDPDSSSLPAGALEYTFTNTSDQPQTATFSFNSENFLNPKEGSIGPIPDGFVLYKDRGEKRDQNAAFAFFVDGEKDVVVDHCWFRGGWFDKKTVTWNNVENRTIPDNPPVSGIARGASLAVPFTLKPGESKTIRLLTAWYTPKSNLRSGKPSKTRKPCECANGKCDIKTPKKYVPWYATKFKSVEDVAKTWKDRYDELRKRSEVFRDAFYDSTLPPEVIEAVAANLAILKSPTVLRQHDGRLWCWEGCCDGHGCCSGSCTHVWNYAQAFCHLFPSLERSLRQTEFNESQDPDGHQTFRSNLPITPVDKRFHAASDGQLGGIMKFYRDWTISADDAWLKKEWPKVKKSLDYMIKNFDPRHTGLLEEEHHNTYDINYFGPDGHCGSFYLGALAAAIEMGKKVGDDVSLYEELLAKGKKRMVKELFNGEYFIQIIQKDGLKHNYKRLDPKQQSEAYREMAKKISDQGPKYQYGNGCLSDGVLGLWMAKVCGLEDEIIDDELVRKHLMSVHKYNLKKDLSRHNNPQRPTFAMGDDGGLLLCTWPHGDALTLPFVYSNEVWTGIEYQVASHLMLMGCVDEGCEIVRVCRKRYDGARRNPFDEYECGHFYARALSSYGMIQGLTGVRYDARTKTLYVDSKVGDFRSFLSTATGFGVVEFKDGKVTVDVRRGTIPVEHTVIGSSK